MNYDSSFVELEELVAGQPNELSHQMASPNNKNKIVPWCFTFTDVHLFIAY